MIGLRLTARSPVQEDRGLALGQCFLHARQLVLRQREENRDGIDLDGCRNVRVSNTSINSPNDDALVLKGSHALGFGRATENMTITNVLVGGVAATGQSSGANWVTITIPAIGSAAGTA